MILTYRTIKSNAKSKLRANRVCSECSALCNVQMTQCACTLQPLLSCLNVQRNITRTRRQQTPSVHPVMDGQWTTTHRQGKVDDVEPRSRLDSCTSSNERSPRHSTLMSICVSVSRPRYSSAKHESRYRLYQSQLSHCIKGCVVDKDRCMR